MDKSLVAIEALLKGPNGSKVQEKLEEIISQNKFDLKAVWLTVNLGTYKNSQRILGALQALGHKVYELAEKMLSLPKFPIESEEAERDLVELSVGDDLGFKEEAKANWDMICKKVVSLGYKLCPPEVGPMLLIQHGKQINKIRWVAMKPIKIGGYSHVLYVGLSGAVRWLDTSDYVDSGDVWDSSRVVVAVRPRKVS